MRVDIYKTDMDNWYVFTANISHGPFPTEEQAELYLRRDLCYNGEVRYYGPVKEPRDVRED